MGDAAPAGDGGALGPAASLVEEPRRADGQRPEPLAAALDLGRFACKELRPLCPVPEAGRGLLDTLRTREVRLPGGNRRELQARTGGRGGVGRVEAHAALARTALLQEYVHRTRQMYGIRLLMGCEVKRVPSSSVISAFENIT